MGLPINTPQTTADPNADLAFLEAAIKKPEANLAIKKIAKHLTSVWEQNQKDNKQVRLDMINSLRRVRGEYDPIKLAAIKAFKGSEVYIRSSENKARSADSWLKDIYRGDTDAPWTLEPTAIPDLPNETVASIEQECQIYAQQMEQQLIASGAINNPETPVDPNQIAQLIQQYYEERLDQEMQKMEKTAKDKCNRAAKQIRDQNQEGGWNDAFKEFLYYFIRLKAGIIKGPVLTKKKKQVWQPNEQGGYSLEVIDTLVNDVYCVSPFAFFPSKGMKKINDGDIIEIHELSKQSLADLIGVPGYSEQELRTVLDKYAKGDLKAKWFTIDDEVVVKQVTKEKNFQTASTPPTQSTTDLATDTIFAQEFYGTIGGSLLIEWGVAGNLDPNIQYQCNCWKIGDHVIKAVINPDSLGRKPYHVSSWAKNPEWIWGEGLIDFSAAIEDILNSITRALQNNIAIASGPLVEIDKDRVDDRSPLYPWRQILSTSMQMKNEGPAVSYYQPQMHTQELIQAWQFFAKVLDEMTVPAYAQGASQSGVTAGTATVFTQLLAAASRSIKCVAANIDDDVFTPYFTMCYDQLMKFSEDESLKGDAKVVAKGVSGLLAKEQQSQRKTEFLQIAATPLLAQVLGGKNIGAILAQIAKSNDISLPDIDRLEGNPTAEAQLMSMIQSMAGIDMTANTDQQTGQGSKGGSPKKSAGQNPDGSKAGVNNG
jgi:hypothetical protein